MICFAYVMYRAGVSGPGGPPQSSKRLQQTQAQVDEVCSFITGDVYF